MQSLCKRMYSAASTLPAPVILTSFIQPRHTCTYGRGTEGGAVTIMPDRHTLSVGHCLKEKKSKANHLSRRPQLAVHARRSQRFLAERGQYSLGTTIFRPFVMQGAFFFFMTQECFMRAEQPNNPRKGIAQREILCL